MNVSEYGGLEPLKIQNEIQGSTMTLTEETNEKKKRNRNRESKTRKRWSTLVPTTTGIGQIFHNKHIFNNNNITFQVEIWKMARTNVFFFQFPGILCPLNGSDTQERELQGACPQPPLGACSLGPSFRKSVMVLILPHGIEGHWGTRSTSDLLRRGDRWDSELAGHWLSKLILLTFWKYDIPGTFWWQLSSGWIRTTTEKTHLKNRHLCRLFARSSLFCSYFLEKK